MERKVPSALKSNEMEEASPCSMELIILPTNLNGCLKSTNRVALKIDFKHKKIKLLSLSLLFILPSAFGQIEKKSI